MGRKKLYATEAERKAARAKYDEKYYRRNRKKILKKQKKRHMERLALQEAGSLSKKTQNVAPPTDTTMSLPKRISKASRQLLVIDVYISEWRRIIGPSAKKYCIGMYMSALKMDSGTAFKSLSDAHTELEDVQSKIGSALNNILEASGTNCQEYRKGEEMMQPVKDCVSAMFDLWEAAAEDEEDYPATMKMTFARGGFGFQKWE